jgi:ceramide glucosyltransferase
MSSLTIAGGAVVAVIVLYHAFLIRGLRLRTRLPEHDPPSWPTVALFRPIRGMDPGADVNIASLFALDYPGEVELVFLFDDDSDPSYPLVQAAITMNPQRRARIILTGEPPPHRTGKINKMIKGAELVKADILAFSDSDTRPAKHVLKELVSILWADEKRGIVFAPTVAVAEKSRIGDVGYALLVNAWYGAAVNRVAGESGEVPFAMGQLMALRSTAVDAIGGMRAAEGELVDDMFLGSRMRALGYSNVTGRTRVPVMIGGMSLGDFLKVFRKWIFFSQSGLPAAFKRAGWMRALTGFAAWGVLIVAIAYADVAAIIAGVVALIAFMASQARLSRALGGASVPFRGLWLAATLPFLATGVAASTKVNREVTWRGRRYRLDTKGKLQRVAAPARYEASR